MQYIKQPEQDLTSNRSVLSVIFHPFSPANILAIYIALKPLYLFPSGLPQISDMLLIVYAVYTIISFGGSLYIKNEQGDATIKSLAGLIVYQTLVNFIWSAITGENMYTVNLYYVFNFITFTLCFLLLNLVSSEEIKNGIVNGCVLSCAISLVGLYVGGSSVRSVSFFNNPNQLGYHGLLLVSLLFLCIKQSTYPKTIFVSIGCIWLIIASASKAALFGVFALFILYLLFGVKSRSIGLKLAQLVLVGFIFVAVYILLFSSNYRIASNPRIAFLRYRIINMQAEDDSEIYSGRGYDRIGEMGANILWGMGEGANYRFQSMHGAEVHSTYASFIVSYGLIGFAWLLYIFLSIIRGNTLRATIGNLAIMSGFLLYGVSHNGIRNTLLWIFLSIIMISNVQSNDEQSVEEI